MSETLKLKITEAVKDAMRAQAKERLSTLRMTTAAIKQKEVDERIELNDAQIVDILVKMIKQRKEAAGQFLTAGRTDLSEKEFAEIKVLEEFLPAQVSDEEVDATIQEMITSLQASSAKDMGKVMTELKLKLGGRADMAVVGQKVKKLLTP
ncbi:MAG: GatB/YqeY domain-containing protein [Gammaproteobacteria bacterium]|nr:GatB/YqeY domain-containing protein [Gammaproteobacteria bacterium]